MENLVFHNPTRLLFGRGQISQLKPELERFGRRILLVYGGGSIKKSGLYDQVMAILTEVGAQVHELPGVEPNPRLTTVQKGVDLCRKEQIDLILAVGGGSVIDCVKAIAVGARFDGDVWDVITKKAQATGALPFGTILTLAATGSEMNPGSVITNWATQEKVGWNAAPHSYPTFSICDPTYTFTVPRDQTVYGIVDMMSHALETYFPGAANTPVQDRWIEGLLRTIIEAGPVALANPESYEARETLMYASTMALNRFTSIGTLGDWATHSMEHAVSAVYDIPHGGGLAILFPHWMRYCLAAKPERFAQLAVRLFDVEVNGRTDAEVGLEGIERLAAFWVGIGAPSRLADYGIGAEQIEVMAAKATPNGTIGRTRVLGPADVAEIYRLAL